MIYLNDGRCWCRLGCHHLPAPLPLCARNPDIYEDGPSYNGTFQSECGLPQVVASLGVGEANATIGPSGKQKSGPSWILAAITVGNLRPWHGPMFKEPIDHDSA